MKKPSQKTKSKKSAKKKEEKYLHKKKGGRACKFNIASRKTAGDRKTFQGNSEKRQRKPGRLKSDL